MHLGLSHLHEHKFRQCFQDTLNLLWECGKDIESAMHFFFHCTNFIIPKQNLFQKYRNIDDSILSQSGTQHLLYGNENDHSSINSLTSFQPSNTYIDWKIQMRAFWLKCFFAKKASNFYFKALSNVFILTSLNPKVPYLVVHD